MQAQTQKKLVDHLVNIKGIVDTNVPKNFKLPSQRPLAIRQSRPQGFRQMEIDHENNMLLSKIMGIMKRKNKSVHQARHIVR